MQCLDLRQDTALWPDILPFLAKDPLRNQLIAGAWQAFTGLNRHRDCAFALLDSKGALALLAVCCHPYPLLLSQGRPEAAAALAASPLMDSISSSRVNGPEPLIAAFEAAWPGRLEPVMQLELRATGSAPPRIESPGHLRLAEARDLPLLRDWRSAFVKAVKQDAEEEPMATLQLRQQIEAGRQFLWEDAGEAVSCCGITPASPLGPFGRVNFVYTPPEARGRGYAKACVGAVTAWQLAEGWSHCLLFVDRGNPVTLALYDALGYTALDRFQEIALKPALDA